MSSAQTRILEAWFEEHTGEHFLKGAIQRSTRDDLIAFNRLNELVPGKSDIVMAADHDQIWLGIDLDALAEVATEDDVIFLLNHGVLLDADQMSLRMHV